MIFPTVHMNGTSKEALIEGFLDARGAVMGAIRALRNAHPNGRDYYLQGPDAIRTAEREHSARIDALDAVANDLMLLAEHCQDS